MQLETERLIFSKYTENDFADYFAMVGDERVMRMITGKALNEAKASTRFATLLATNELHPEFGYYKVLTKNNLEHIGLGKLTLMKQGEAEVGYMLRPAYWGKGYGSEISDGLIKYARTLKQLHTLMAIIDPENTASKRILENAGFTLDEVCVMDGLPAAIYRLTIL